MKLMVNLCKPFGEWVTNLKSDIFKLARVKLTVMYLVIIGVVLTASSVLLYCSFADHVHSENFKRGIPLPYAYVNEQSSSSTPVTGDQENFIDDTLENIEAYIIVIDLFIFILCAILSYALAGYTLKPIKKALNAQESFSADASHELRTPLSIIKNSIEVALRAHNTSEDEMRKVLQSCLEEANYMGQTTESLLQLARGSQDNNNETFEVLSSKNILEPLLEKIKESANIKNIDLFLNTDDNAEYTIAGNKNILQRLFFNLLENAIAYTPSGGEVRINQNKIGHFWQIEISDNGIGIGEKDLPHIFERFYKVNSSRSIKENSRGNGLGLSIVKNAVELHHGNIEVTSKLNQGTKIIVKLPIHTS